jgi:hypothetical protein
MNKTLAVAGLLLGAIAIGFATNNQPSGAFIGPRVVAKIDVLNQTGQISPTTLLTPRTSGMFRVSVYETMVAAGDGNSVQINWTDEAGVQSANVGGTNFFTYCVSQAGPPPCGTTLYAVGGTPIIYSTSADSNGGTYDLHIVVERLE